jgi:hypothetical protein
MKKIAFCFLIYDQINNEELWDLFFKNIDSNKYTIYIHFKTQKPLKYFEKYKITNCIETKYENQTIPLAYNVLFRNAFKSDPDNYKFIIVSGSCIPLKSFDHIYTKLTNDDFGYFNVCPTKQCFPNCNSLLKIIENKYISKSHNWFILNRKLVENLCFEESDKILKSSYTQVYAPAEYFYYTFIKVLNLESEIIITHNKSNDATTFTDWGDIGYKYELGRGGLKLYKSINKEELLYLLNSNCLFGRKFTNDCFKNLHIQEYIDRISTKIDG